MMRTTMAHRIETLAADVTGAARRAAGGGRCWPHGVAVGSPRVKPFIQMSQIKISP
jgi:hypothetical protein